ncbi:DUF429 domain-containing protein [Thermosynechococcaceae cyanobacterium Okahandja]
MSCPRVQLRRDPMRFLGVDLGWMGGESGYCCLEGQGDHLTLCVLGRAANTQVLLEWIERDAPEAAMIGVDAPLVIPNARGMRTCDRHAHQLLGRFHAGCYPANQGCRFAPYTTGFSHALAERGFGHAPTVAPRQPGRFQIEVFPHATAVALFRLQRIIKYKKGSLALRRQGLGQLQGLIETGLPQCHPSLKVQFPQPLPTTGKGLKALEDQLDALLCAYTAASWWYWGSDRHWVLGGATFSEQPASLEAYLSTGYIVVPRPPA